MLIVLVNENNWESSMVSEQQIKTPRCGVKPLSVSPHTHPKRSLFTQQIYHFSSTLLVLFPLWVSVNEWNFNGFLCVWRVNDTWCRLMPAGVSSEQNKYLKISKCTIIGCFRIALLRYIARSDSVHVCMRTSVCLINPFTRLQECHVILNATIQALNAWLLGAGCPGWRII